jgi:hypothetical protein
MMMIMIDFLTVVPDRCRCCRSHGQVDTRDLEAHLQRLNARDGATCPALKIGSFSAASNITGVLADTVAIRYASAEEKSRFCEWMGWGFCVCVCVCVCVCEYVFFSTSDLLCFCGVSFFFLPQRLVASLRCARSV